MQTVAIKGEKRTDLGKSASRQLRRDGRVPFVIYGGDQEIHGSVHPLDVRSIIYTGDFKLADVEVDGATHSCIVKDVQFHPVTDDIMHIDFLRLIEGHPIKVEVPVRFTGTSPGIRAGGKLMTKLRRIKIKTVPEKLVDQMVLDISELELGNSLRVRDLDELDGIEIMNSPGIPVASVEVPRALKSAEAGAEAEEGEEAAEGEGEEGGDSGAES